MRRRRSSPWLADELPGEGVDGFAFVELGVGSALRRSTVTRRGERSSSFNPSLRKISPEAALLLDRYQQLEEARLQQPDQAPQRQDRAGPKIGI